MSSDEKQLAELARELASKQAAQPKYEPKRVRPSVPSEPSAERLDALEQRQRLASRLEREGRVAFGLRSLENQRGVRYVGCRLGNFEYYADPTHAAAQKSVVDQLRNYCERLPENAADAYGVFLYGPCGTGKDHLAMAVARAFVKQLAEPVKWACGADFYREIRDSFDGEKSESRVLSPYMAAPLLWLSDPLPVMGDTLKEYQAADLYAVIERRYSARRPMVITANLKPGEADAKFGPAIARRLRETMLALYCDWPSYRR